MKLDDLRAEFDKGLRGTDSTTKDHLWEEATERGIVDEVCNYGMPFDDLMDHAKETLKWWRKREGRTEASTKRNYNKRQMRVSLSKAEQAHKAALEEYLAMCAAAEADVFQFRDEVLKKTLTATEARKFINSPAARILTRRQFANWNIPIADHESVLEEHSSSPSRSGRKFTATITVSSPNITKQVSMTTYAGFKNTDKHRLTELDYPTAEGNLASVQVWSVSVLGDLNELSSKLSKRYRWQRAQAAWFVLTGDVPAVPSLKVIRNYNSSMHHIDCTITIEASPWVSSETVELAYKRAQSRAMGGKVGKPTGERNLNVFGFVSSKTDAIGLLKEGRPPHDPPAHLRKLELITNHYYLKTPAGKELVKEWNKTFPQWSYGDNSRLFWRDYHRGSKGIPFGPPYEYD